MSLTTGQLQTMKADILANSDLNTKPQTTDGALAIANLYNLTSVPDFWIWRTAVTKAEIVTAISRTGTSFIWAGNGFITRSAGEVACWDQLFNTEDVCRPALANVRQAFVDIFSGTGNAATNRTHLDVVARRKATRVERLYATGAGSDTTANSGNLVVEGPISYQEVLQARELP